jgi:transcriptional regulator of acetoin/glycerol metabolism
LTCPRSWGAIAPILRPSIDIEIRERTDAFVAEVMRIVKRLALDAVQDGLEVVRPGLPGDDRIVERDAAPADDGVPLRLEAYARAAFLRALRESGGRAAVAARILGLTRSSMYRRMDALGIARQGRRGSAAFEEPPLTTGGPVSIRAYERLALERALAAEGGDVIAAARRLGIGKSTLYRKLAGHGIEPTAASRSRPSRQPAG